MDDEILYAHFYQVVSKKIFLKHIFVIKYNKYSCLDFIEK